MAKRSVDPWRKGLHSEGLGVHPKQVKEAERLAKERGVPTHYDEMARPVFTSRKHRRDFLKAFHFHDRDGGYGDG